MEVCGGVWMCVSYALWVKSKIVSCIPSLIYHVVVFMFSVFHVVVRNVLDIINKSLVSGVVPTFLNHAVVQPLQKKGLTWI